MPRTKLHWSTSVLIAMDSSSQRLKLHSILAMAIQGTWAENPLPGSLLLMQVQVRYVKNHVRMVQPYNSLYSKNAINNATSLMNKMLSVSETSNINCHVIPFARRSCREAPHGHLRPPQTTRPSNFNRLMVWEIARLSWWWNQQNLEEHNHSVICIIYIYIYIYMVFMFLVL